MKNETPAGQSKPQLSPLRTVGFFLILTVVLFVVMLQVIFTGRSVIAQALEHSGNINFNDEKWEEAQWAYQGAMRWNPYNHHIYYGLGISSAKLLQADRARFAFQQGLDASPNHVPSQIELARLQIQSGDFDEAEALLDSADTSVPHFWRIHQSRALLEENRGNVLEAIAEMEQALYLKLRPLPIQYVQLGNLQLQVSQYAGAQATATKAWRADRNSPSVFLLKGRIAAQQGKFNQAITLLQDALGKFTSPPYDVPEWSYERSETYMAMAKVMLDTRRFNDALDNYILALGDTPNALPLKENVKRIIHWQQSEGNKLSPMESYNMGRLAMAGNHPDEALNYLSAALEGDLDDKNACRLEIAHALKKLERYSEAIDILKEITPPSSDSMLLSAETYEAMGKPASARFEYTSLLQMFLIEDVLRADIIGRIESLKAAQ